MSLSISAWRLILSLLYVINNLVYFEIPSSLTSWYPVCGLLTWHWGLESSGILCSSFTVRLVLSPVQVISNLLVVLSLFILCSGYFPFNISQGILQTSVSNSDGGNGWYWDSFHRRINSIRTGIASQKNTASPAGYANRA